MDNNNEHCRMTITLDLSHSNKIKVVIVRHSHNFANGMRRNDRLKLSHEEQSHRIFPRSR
jgi:hypothetical protein